MRLVVIFLKTVFALVIILLGIMTAVSGSWAETILLLAALLFIFPFLQNRLSRRHGEKKARRIRFIFSIVFFAVALTLLDSQEKQSIYKSEEYKAEAYQLYDKLMQDWPGEYEDIFLDTKYGKVHVIESGNRYAPTVVCLHAASMGGWSWAMNVGPLLDDYHIYAIDNLGEIGKSELTNVGTFPADGKELADLYVDILDKLSVDTAFLLAASNGGFIASNLAYYFPERINGMVLIGPQGLTPLTAKSVFMMSIGSMYPFSFIRDWVTGWAIGNDPRVQDATHEWFDLVVKASMPSIAHPVVLTAEQKQTIEMPVLLFLGSRDKIVGDAETARQAGEEYPNIRIIVLESGHLIQVEKAAIVNPAITRFLEEHY